MCQLIHDKASPIVGYISLGCIEWCFFTKPDQLCVNKDVGVVICISLLFHKTTRAIQTRIFVKCFEFS